MQHIKRNIFWVVIMVFVIAASSCNKDFDEVNTDPNTTPFALPQQLLAPALVNTLNYTMIRSRNFNNELMQVSVDLSDAEGKVFRYDYRANFADYLYNGMYPEIANFKEIYRIASSGVSANRSYMGISLICQAWAFSILTDTYGDVPYLQAGLGRDSGILEPRFDKQRDIYFDLFNKLDSANVMLSGNTAILAGSDPVYGGNISYWRKFGNSLYLRLLLRISGKAEATEFCKAKIKSIVETNISTYPIISSLSESAILKWTGASPYVSPLSIQIREQDFRQPGLASFFIDNLVNWADPRIDISQGSNGINRFGIAPSLGAFAGVPSGYAPGANPIKKSYFYSNTSTTSLQTDPLGGMMLNYAEVKFILAEAAAKGWISGSAKTYYADGVSASIKQWLPNWSVPVDTYINAADIQYYDTASLDRKMETIHLQKYYALFMADMQQWFEYRRTGHPRLPAGTGLRNNGIMPARITYPVYVQSTNPTNYQMAVSAQGPDVISTQVWWQKP